MSKITLKHDIEFEADYIQWFLRPEDPYGAVPIILQDHPKLEDYLSVRDTLSEDDQFNYLVEYLKKYYTTNTQDVKKSIKDMQGAWGSLEEPLLKILADIFEMNYEELPQAEAFVGSISIYPRNINESNFLIGYHQQIFDALKTIVHEYTHFLYFYKWYEFFPEDKDFYKDGEGPLWVLSELLDIAMTSDERIALILPDITNQVFHYNAVEYERTTMPGTQDSIAGYFHRAYLEHKKSKSSLKSFFQKCRKDIFSIEH